jgi:glyoxylase-like metal-dependent hydrolase (beta-lactamase superfamily II)
VAVTKVHHLDLCTMCPIGQRWFGRFVVHSLLVETSDRLVLVDTGFGLDDMREPKKRLGAAFVYAVRGQLGEEHTAIRQVERLGYAAKDVRDLVPTHLDVDHAGGIPDFPDAAIHVTRRERDSALARSSFRERERYRPAHFAHGPKWEVHEPGGDKWMGFESVQAIADDVLLIPMPGHTWGHACVAVKAPPGSAFEWYLHCGDAYFSCGEKTDPGDALPGVRAFQAMIAMDDDLRRANAGRLRELYASDNGKRVKMFSAHCPTEFAELSRGSTGSRT